MDYNTYLVKKIANEIDKKVHCSLKPLHRLTMEENLKDVVASFVGTVPKPVIKVTRNPETFMRRLADNPHTHRDTDWVCILGYVSSIRDTSWEVDEHIVWAYRDFSLYKLYLEVYRPK